MDDGWSKIDMAVCEATDGRWYVLLTKDGVETISENGFATRAEAEAHIQKINEKYSKLHPDGFFFVPEGRKQ